MSKKEKEFERKIREAKRKVDGRRSELLSDNRKSTKVFSELLKKEKRIYELTEEL